MASSDDRPPPQGLIEIAIEPKFKADQEKLSAALTELAAEDPTFGFSTDPESGQTILRGASELHLDSKVKLLRQTGKIDVRIGAPQVAFRERVTRRVEHSFTHKRQTGGIGQFAAVTIVVEPNEPDKGYEFESKVVGGAVPDRFIPAIEKGRSQRSGLRRRCGFPGRRRQGATRRRQIPRHRLDGARLRNRGARLLSSSAAGGQVGAARADHEGRGGDADGLHQRRHRRFEITTRRDPGAERTRQRQRHHSNRAAHEDVRLRE